jgi:hypothetical protein
LVCRSYRCVRHNPRILRDADLPIDTLRRDPRDTTERVARHDDIAWNKELTHALAGALSLWTSGPQGSHSSEEDLVLQAKYFERPAGFEPTTPWFVARALVDVGRHSIQRQAIGAKAVLQVATLDVRYRGIRVGMRVGVINQEKAELRLRAEIHARRSGFERLHHEYSLIPMQPSM